MATAQNPAGPPTPTVRPGVQPLRAGEGNVLSSGASCTRCWASSPSAPSCWSICSRTSRRSKAPSPTARRSSSSTACRWCACWSGSSSSCPSSITACYGVWIWLRGKSNIVYYPWAGNWMYIVPALHRPDRLALHHAARDSPALHGRQPAGESLRRLPQGADGAGQSLDAGRLRRSP